MKARRTPTRPKFPKTATYALFGSLALVGSGILASPVQADPAVLPDPLAWEQTTPGQFQIVVPDGICSAYGRIAGGAGNNQVFGSSADAGGAGALIDFTLPVVSGDTLSGIVGAGATSSAGAAPGGGDGYGGAGGHGGGGGGGYSELLLGADLLVLAGGGGGSGGGHDPLLGWGGSAGVPTGAGVFAGEDGTAGQDGSDGAPGGGRGGQTGGPGAGGVHSFDATLNGFPGVARSGGNGGVDLDIDTGGGGGGGFYGGGGGASTVSSSVTGGGAGGGSSYVSGDVVFGSAGLNGSGAAPPAGDDDPDNPDLPDVEGVHGAVGFEWIPCEYDLEIDKKVSDKKTYPNKPVTYTVKVKNNGEDPMGGGDTVTITDPMAVGGTIKSVKVSGGSDHDVTCTPGPGDSIDADTIECSRPLPGSASGVRGLDVGEVLTITYTKKFTALGTVENTASITDRGDPLNNESVATVKVVARPLPDTGRTMSGSTGPLGAGAAALLAAATLCGWAVRRREHAA